MVSVQFMYTYDVQYPEFDCYEVKEMGQVDATGALEAFRSFPFRELILKAEALGPDSTAPTMSFRSKSDEASLSFCMRSPDYGEVRMENAGDEVTVGPVDDQVMIDAITTFFFESHGGLFERLAIRPKAVVHRRLWNQLRSLFSKR